MSAIAQHWRDFREHYYRSRAMAPELEREYRMIFYSGFHACQLYFGDMSRSGASAEELQHSVMECFEEFDRFVKDYLAERQREQ